tara:strand:- start:16910 stop:17086 length:177 start_codon:yes stop_codon:yes gene_type:complete
MYDIMDENIQNIKYPKGRKTLAVDVDTYNLLQDICNKQRRSKIDQLKILIEKAHNEQV